MSRFCEKVLKKQAVFTFLIDICDPKKMYHSYKMKILHISHRACQQCEELSNNRNAVRFLTEKFPVLRVFSILEIDKLTLLV